MENLLNKLKDRNVYDALEVAYRKRINQYCIKISELNNSRELRIQKMSDWLRSGTFDYHRFKADQFRIDMMEDRMSIEDYQRYLRSHLQEYEEFFGEYPDKDQILRVLPDWK